MAGGSEIAGERLRRAAFGPKIPPDGEAKLPDFGLKVPAFKRTVTVYLYMIRTEGRSLKRQPPPCPGLVATGCLSGALRITPRPPLLWVTAVIDCIMIDCRPRLSAVQIHDSDSKRNLQVHGEGPSPVRLAILSVDPYQFPVVRTLSCCRAGPGLIFFRLRTSCPLRAGKRLTLLWTISSLRP